MASFGPGELKIVLVSVGGLDGTDDFAEKLVAELERRKIVVVRTSVGDAEEDIDKEQPHVVVLCGTRGASVLSTLLDDGLQGTRPRLVVVALRSELAKLQGLNRNVVAGLLASDLGERLVVERLQTLARQAARLRQGGWRKPSSPRLGTIRLEEGSPSRPDFFEGVDSKILEPLFPGMEEDEAPASEEGKEPSSKPRPTARLETKSLGTKPEASSGGVPRAAEKSSPTSEKLTPKPAPAAEKSSPISEKLTPKPAPAAEKSSPISEKLTPKVPDVAEKAAFEKQTPKPPVSVVRKPEPVKPAQKVEPLETEPKSEPTATKAEAKSEPTATKAEAKPTTTKAESAQVEDSKPKSDAAHSKPEPPPSEPKASSSDADEVLAASAPSAPQSAPVASAPAATRSEPQADVPSDADVMEVDLASDDIEDLSDALESLPAPAGHSEPPPVALPEEPAPVSEPLERIVLPEPKPAAMAASKAQSAGAAEPDRQPRKGRWKWLAAAVLLGGGAAGVYLGLVPGLASSSRADVQRSQSPRGEGPQASQQAEPASAEADAVETAATTSGEKSEPEQPANDQPAEQSSADPFRVKEKKRPGCEGLTRDFKPQMVDSVQEASLAWKNAREAIVKGDLETAEQRMCEAVLLHDESAALEGLVMLYVTHQAPTLALKYLERAEAVRPNELETMNLRGDVHSQLGDSDKALAAWLQALRVEPSETNRRKTAAKDSVAQGQAQLRRGALPQAERWLRRAATLDPENILALTGLAEVFLKTERAPEAAELARRALAVSEHLPQAHVILGDVARDANRADEAREHYKRALAVRSDHWPAKHRLQELDSAK